MSKTEQASAASAPSMIDLSHRLQPIVRAAQAPKGHEVDITESLIRLETLLRETVEKLYPDAYVMTTQLYSKDDDAWLHVSIEWRSKSAAPETLLQLPAHVDIGEMMTGIYAACQQVRADEARWLVTSPYARETCGECGEQIEPTERYVPLAFFSPGWAVKGTVHDIFIHERCLERLQSHFTTDIRVSKVEQGKKK